MKGFIVPRAGTIAFDTINGIGYGVRNGRFEMITDTEMVTISNENVTIYPNKYYKFENVTSLQITLGDGISDIVNHYMFQFYSRNNPFELSFTSDVNFISDKIIKPNKTYIVSILNGIGVMCNA